MFNLIEGDVTLVDSVGEPLATNSGVNGPTLVTSSLLDTTVSGEAIRVREQNRDGEGFINQSSHNMAHQNGAWQPFTLDDQGRLRVAVNTVADPHDLSGPLHIGLLDDSQIPIDIVRMDQLTTLSGILQDSINNIDGGYFI